MGSAGQEGFQLMGSIRKTWGDVVSLWSLIVGLKVTGRYFFRDQVTVHYPRRSVENLDTFRGPIQLVGRSDDPGKPLCIACMTCASNCPSGCISVARKESAAPKAEDTKEAGDGDEKGKKKARKEPGSFRYDYTLCSLCGLCVENCPVHAIRFSNRAYLAGQHREDFVFDLLAMLEAKKAVIDTTMPGVESHLMET